MSDEARRKILEQVAAGHMDPGDAADALAALDAPAAASGTVTPPVAEDAERVVERHVITTSSGESDRRVRMVRVDANFRPVEIVGDAGVKEAVAEGSHRVRWEGDTLVIDGATGFDDDEDWDDDDSGDFGEWFRTRGPRMARNVRISYSHGSGPNYRPKPLRVRMNPDVELDARVEAGPLKIVRVHGPIKARVAAGPLKIEDFESPLDLRVAAGTVDASGRLDHGDSTIDCDAGKVRLHLTHGSHARVSASATLGKVGFGGRKSKVGRDFKDEIRDTVRSGVRGSLGDLSGLGDHISSILNNAFSDEHEVTVGRGTATIDIRVSMGAADITFDDSPSDE